MTNKRRPISKLKDIEDLHVEQLEKIKLWRKGTVAAVDVYGCEKLADPEAKPSVTDIQYCTCTCNVMYIILSILYYLFYMNNLYNLNTHKLYYTHIT